MGQEDSIPRGARLNIGKPCFIHDLFRHLLVQVGNDEIPKREGDLIVFAFAALAAVFIAMMTVSLQALKAALTNPIKSLRTE